MLLEVLIINCLIAKKTNDGEGVTKENEPVNKVGGSVRQ